MSSYEPHSCALRFAALTAFCLVVGGYAGTRLSAAEADRDAVIPAVAPQTTGTAAQTTDEPGAIAAFNAAYSVLSHPRCVNCHPSGTAPLQGDDGHPHAFRVRRGPDGGGIAAERCSNCHQAANLAGAHMPPGAPFPLEAKESPFTPRWRLPSSQTPMVFQGRTAAQLCRQLKTPGQNGGLSLDQLVHHVQSDPLVLWGFDPGEGRTRPPLSHAEFVQRIIEWVSKGGACPQ